MSFRSAIEAGDIAAAVELLDEEVVFRSPIVYRPYAGRDAVAHLLRAVISLIEDFRYVREIGDGPDQALVFRARVGDREIEGCDFLHFADDGTIDELYVMVRPLSGALALAEGMKPLVEGLAPS